MIIRNTEHGIYIMDQIELFRVLDDIRGRQKRLFYEYNTMNFLFFARKGMKARSTSLFKTTARQPYPHTARHKWVASGTPPSAPHTACSTPGPKSKEVANAFAQDGKQPGPSTVPSRFMTNDIFFHRFDRLQRE